MSKKEIILNTLIEEYLKHNAPIGSNELRDKLELDMSPSTIRVYFKKLSMEGILTQLHTSSGRIPTWSALKEYWRERFYDVDTFRISSIEDFREWIREFDIYCMLQLDDETKLSEIINIEDRFLLIVFEDKSIALRYNEKVERFLQTFIGYDINSVKNISVNVGLYELKRKIEQLLEDNLLLLEKEEVLYDMAKESNFYTNIRSFMKTSLFEKLENGVYFEELVPKGYMAVKYDALIDEKEANIFCIGRADRDYREFLRRCA